MITLVVVLMDSCLMKMLSQMVLDTFSFLQAVTDGLYMETSWSVRQKRIQKQLTTGQPRCWTTERVRLILGLS